MTFNEFGGCLLICMAMVMGCFAGCSYGRFTPHPSTLSTKSDVPDSLLVVTRGGRSDTTFYFNGLSSQHQ